ncbi:DNA-3-methyladenine glycosylase I [Acetobacter estunensis NRIC 0472]|uniref:DNA-3-methyladenine glycosylase I n=1 Tax=Acetobacter estunensis TaxID=104097 RepID=A0A967EAI4_9PROT|nr:DNA-3-methyladenine glycosylase I [Acetobacter estunensis]NHO52388.1 DNA-3-methyladenine glycosylase I [Acetobacter estunensis]GBQ25843.1 DNA-3-methyladenine glycosylase I [Acetobacter estunensis NRIC 0472]
MTLHTHADGVPRCAWCAATPSYMAYHDHEWGFPVADDRRLFEKLCLESFQCGLSWRTILEKRENFRAAFDNFDHEKIAHYDERDVQRLLANSGIVRHRGKIEAVINNARRMSELLEREDSLAAWLWRFEPPRTPSPQMLTETEVSRTLSKELRKRGWKFVGPTTLHAFMQAMGLVNDHAEGCALRAKAEAARARFVVPR